MMHNGPRDFLAGLAGGPLMNRQGDLFVPELGLMDALQEAGRDGIHSAKRGGTDFGHFIKVGRLLSPAAILKHRA
jgi:hypothetical protein